MAISPMGWLVLGSIGSGIGYLVWSWNAAPAELPKGLARDATLPPGGTLRDRAEELHAAINDQLVERLDPLREEGRVERRLAACEEGLVKSVGVLNPPGPVRVQLEERKPGDQPGVRFALVLTRASVRAPIQLHLRGNSSALFGLPQRASTEASRVFVEAVRKLEGEVEG